MFQKKKDKLYSSLPKVFGISDDFLIAGFNEQGKANNETVDKLLQAYRQANLKLYKDKFLFR